MNKKSIFIAMAIVAFTFVIYAYLGGYNKLEFDTEIRDMSIYGKPYLGPIKSSDLGNLFEENKQLSLKYNTSLAVVDYGLVGEDSVKQFIGIITEDSISEYSIQMNEVTFLKTLLTANPAVMPSPEAVRDQANDYAKSNNLVLDDFSIEIYQTNGNIEVYFPTKAF